MSAQAALLPDGRLHLHHGPIDLIVDVAVGDRRPFFDRATTRFSTILDELTQDLSALRRVHDPNAVFRGDVARRLSRRLAPFDDRFVTPMAGIAGAVAEEILRAMIARTNPPKAYVNNGGDIAFHLTEGRFTAAGAAGEIRIAPEDATRGVATSGWRGRSWSMGIADAVTVLARDAVTADVAATLIANQVDLPGHPEILRKQAREIAPDTDLGAHKVTVEVGVLSPDDVTKALKRGAAYAGRLRREGVIEAAALCLKGQVLTLEGADADHALR